jgi:hypothetical protein
MAYLKLHGAPVMAPLEQDLTMTPRERLDALIGHTQQSLLVNNFLFGPPTPDTFTFLGIEHQFGCLVDEVGGQDGDFSWVPTIVDAIMLGHDEPVREVITFGFSDRCEISIHAWNSFGDAYYGGIKGFAPGIAAVGGHGHLPKRTEQAAVVDLIEAVSRHLWGPAWAPAVPEEDRC